MPDTSFFMSPYAAPVWVFCGVIVTKTVDYLLARRKEEVDAVAQANNAHLNLNKSLQASFEVMGKELTRLREDRERDAAAWSANEDAYKARIQSLEDELTRVQMLILEAGLTCPNCGPVHTVEVLA